MATNRSKNRFGKRFIRLQELRDNVVNLDLFSHPPGEGLIEFFEKHDLLTPYPGCGATAILRASGLRILLGRLHVP